MSVSFFQQKCFKSLQCETTPGVWQVILMCLNPQFTYDVTINGNTSVISLNTEHTTYAYIETANTRKPDDNQSTPGEQGKQFVIN